jgi:hypothetical protein
MGLFIILVALYLPRGLAGLFARRQEAATEPEDEDKTGSKAEGAP